MVMEADMKIVATRECQETECQVFGTKIQRMKLGLQSSVRSLAQLIHTALYDFNSDIIQIIGVILVLYYFSLGRVCHKWRIRTKYCNPNLLVYCLEQKSYPLHPKILDLLSSVIHLEKHYQFF